MLLVHKTAPNRLDIELNGPIDSGMMAAALDDLAEKSEGITNGVIMYKIPAFSMPSFGAFMVEMGRLPSLFGLIGKFDRCAVLADAAWLHLAAEFEGALIPGLTIKAFNMDQDHAAEAWLAQVDEDEDDDEPNVPV